jgi:hypothetical protein
LGRLSLLFFFREKGNQNHKKFPIHFALSAQKVLHRMDSDSTELTLMMPISPAKNRNSMPRWKENHHSGIPCTSDRDVKITFFELSAILTERCGEIAEPAAFDPLHPPILPIPPML